MTDYAPGADKSATNPSISSVHRSSLTQPPVPELLVLALSAIVRLWRLDYHSIWFDEAISLRWARSAPEYTWDVTLQLVEEKHPPLYYLLLHFWTMLLEPFGLMRSDVALRALGSLLGVLTVLGILLLARRLSGRRIALLAGLLVAIGPALVWYSQELRMFQPATTALIWAAYFLTGAWHSQRLSRRWLWWTAMIVCFEAALYSYLFSAFMLPSAALLLVVLWILGLTNRDLSLLPEQQRKVRRLVSLRFAEGTLALLVTGLLFLPLARNAWVANASDGMPGQIFLDFWPNLQRQLQVATIWAVDWQPAAIAPVLLFFGVLVVAGLVLAEKGPEPQLHSVPHPDTNDAIQALQVQPIDRLFLWCWLGGPLLVGNILLARNNTIFAEDRYFLFLAPLFLWAAARGAVLIGERWRPAGWLISTLALMLLLAALPRLWTPSMFREDWREAARYVIAYQTRSPGLPGAALAHVDYTRNALNWYLRQQFSGDELPTYFPFGGVLSLDEVNKVVAPPLQGIAEHGTQTLWLTQSHLDGLDDQHLVEVWLNENFPLVTEQYPTGVKLSGYALRSQYDALPALGPNTVFPGVQLAPGLTLAACEIMTPRTSATEERMHPPSGWVHLRLWWLAKDSMDTDYTAAVQMVGPEGVWGDRLYRANEALRRWPTSTWTPGTFVRDEVDVNLNPVTPTGIYPIIVGVRDGNGLETGEKANCGQVEITG